MSTVASVLAPVFSGHRAQREAGAVLPIKTLRGGEPLHLGQSKSVKAAVRATLEGQAVSRQHQGAWLGQEGGLPVHSWGEGDGGTQGTPPRGPLWLQ